MAATSGMETEAGKICRKGVRQFDRHCHQYWVTQADLDAGKIPKYADLTNTSGVCDF